MRLVVLLLCLVFATLAIASSVSAQAPPTNVTNRCPGHIRNICVGWDDPAASFASFIVTLTNTLTGLVHGPITVTGATSWRFNGLNAATPYSALVTGVVGGTGLQVSAAAVTFTTDPADPKLDPTLDIRNIVCDSVLVTTTVPSRNVIQCSWTAAAQLLTRLVIKWRCLSEVRERDSNKLRIFGAAAQATSIQLNVNRDVATCTVHFHAYYVRRPATRHQLTVVMGVTGL
jgi:hypothetical protein